MKPHINIIYKDFLWTSMKLTQIYFIIMLEINQLLIHHPFIHEVSNSSMTNLFKKKRQLTLWCIICVLLITDYRFIIKDVYRLWRNTVSSSHEMGKILHRLGYTYFCVSLNLQTIYWTRSWKCEASWMIQSIKFPWGLFIRSCSTSSIIC